MLQCIFCKKDPTPRKMYCAACKPYVGPYVGLREAAFDLIVRLVLSGSRIEDLENHPLIVREKIDLFDVEEECKRRLLVELRNRFEPQNKLEIDYFLDG